MVLEHRRHLDQMRAGPQPDLGRGHLVEAEGVGDAVGLLLAGAQGGGSCERDRRAGRRPVSSWACSRACSWSRSLLLCPGGHRHQCRPSPLGRGRAKPGPGRGRALRPALPAGSGCAGADRNGLRPGRPGGVPGRREAARGALALPGERAEPPGALLWQSGARRRTGPGLDRALGPRGWAARAPGSTGDRQGAGPGQPARCPSPDPALPPSPLVPAARPLPCAPSRDPTSPRVVGRGVARVRWTRDGAPGAGMLLAGGVMAPARFCGSGLSNSAFGAGGCDVEPGTDPHQTIHGMPGSAWSSAAGGRRARVRRRPRRRGSRPARARRRCRARRRGRPISCSAADPSPQEPAAKAAGGAAISSMAAAPITDCTSGDNFAHSAAPSMRSGW